MPTGFILQPTYRIRDGVPVVQLFGRLDGSGPFLVEDDRFRPYFFVPTRGVDALAGERVRVERTNLRDLLDEPVSRVTVDVPSEVRGLRERLRGRGVPAFEADIRFPYRYLMDLDIRAGVEIEGGESRVRGGLSCFHNPDLRPAASHPTLSSLSIDLETTLDASRIFSVAMVGEGVEEVHLVSERSVGEKAAICYASEPELLQAVSARIREIDPDVLLGWNVVDFDLQVFVRRCQELGLRGKRSRLGRVEGSVEFQRDRSFMRQGRAEVPGRAVVDGLGPAREALKLEDFRLETVARAVLGRGKDIGEVPDAGEEIQRMYREDPEALVRYNLEDARLVVDILEQEGLFQLTVERSLLSGMPLDRVSASIASFDRLYLPELRRRGRVAPCVDAERDSAPVRGGAVLDSVPGLATNVAVFDFKSLYPSLVRTFHLDPLALAAGRSSADAIEAPNGARFSRTESVLPDIIESFMAHRDEAKLRGDRHADQAIKIMMNSMFGVFAASACRFFDPGVANAITSFGQQTLGWTCEAFEGAGVSVLYGDTDSVFVKLRADAAGEAAAAEAEELRRIVDREIADRIRETYRVEPRLTLELEKVFDRFFLPRVRGGGGGSKKRYAGRHGGELEVVGLEAVRRDWPALARNLQIGMLERLFDDADVLGFVQQTIARLQEGAADAELVYAKRIRKGSLDRYTASTPPHIQAARKIHGEVPRVVRYVVTRRGPEPVLPGEALPDDLDRTHYLNRVMRPVADAILEVQGLDFDDALGVPKQMTLL